MVCPPLCQRTTGRRGHQCSLGRGEPSKNKDKDRENKDKDRFDKDKGVIRVDRGGASHPSQISAALLSAKYLFINFIKTNHFGQKICTSSGKQGWAEPESGARWVRPHLIICWTFFLAILSSIFSTFLVDFLGSFMVHCACPHLITARNGSL